MYCTNCGTQNDGNNYRCTACGFVLARVDSSGHADDGSGLGPAPSRLAESIIVTILCCWPLGIPAIVFAAQTMGHNSAGRYAEAHASSRKAMTWTWIAFGLGLTLGLVYAAFLVIGAIATTP